MLVELTLCACFVLAEPAAAETAPNSQPAVSDAAPQPRSSAEAPALPAKPAAEKKGADEDLLTIEQNIIYYTNYERTKRGLPPLEADENLMKTARAHAAWMTRRHSLVHANGPVAENIAMGQRSSREAVADWMNSPGHRANILTRSFQRIGVAAYRTSSGTIYWCQQFRR